MQFLSRKFSDVLPKWNKAPLTEWDFRRVCRRHGVTLQEMPLTVSGFYYSVLGQHFIAVDRRLSPAKKLFVMFHEFAHHLLHVPDGQATANYHRIGERTRKEKEADAFALCCLIPRTWLESEEVADLCAEAGYDMEMLRDRLELFDRFGL